MTGVAGGRCPPTSKSLRDFDASPRDIFRKKKIMSGFFLVKVFRGLLWQDDLPSLVPDAIE